MRIIIVGDGKLGSTLVGMLSAEGHDITVIEHRSSVLRDSVNMQDIKGIHGNGASYDVQMEAGVEHADLLIAATSSDELNILCCILAKKLGAKNTIARVRNPEYSKQLRLMQDEIGLSMVISPEREAAREIARNMRLPSALNVDVFARGRVELVELRVTQASGLGDKTLVRLAREFQQKFLVCAVQRGDEVIIPRGDFTLTVGDRIHITASPADIHEFFHRIGLITKRIRTAMIVGGGPISIYLAQQLAAMDIKVKIIEKKPERCEILCNFLPKATVINGDGTDEELLNEEGVRGVDAFVALTDLDEQNIIISMYASAMGVKKVITKIDHIRFREIFIETGVENIVSPINTSADQIMRFVRAMQNSMGSSNVETLHRIVDRRVEALEFTVRHDAAFLNVPISNLKLKSNLLIASITRDGRQNIVPGGDDVIKCGDNVIVVTTQSLRDLGDILR